MFRHLFKTIFFLTVLVLLSCCSNDANQQSEIATDVVNNPQSASSSAKATDLPQIEFQTEEHDFGNVIEGEKVEYSFKFKNTGKSDLIITKAKGSCGCTVPIWPKEPIPSGGEGIIKVSFDSEGRPGPIKKQVTVISNTNPNTKVLRISGTVIKTENH